MPRDIINARRLFLYRETTAMAFSTRKWLKRRFSLDQCITTVKKTFHTTNLTLTGLLRNIFKSNLEKNIKIAFLSVYPMTVDVVKFVKSKHWLGPIGNRTCEQAPSARKHV